MIHLTYIHSHAGKVLCGTHKDTTLHRYYHAGLFRQWDTPTLCQECKRLWLDVEVTDESYIDAMADYIAWYPISR